MDNTNTKEQAVERLKQATNVLVTVSSNPSVDQLSACIGLTLMLNKLGKHGTAVFSGAIPDTIEFLKPETTLEKNTDSLRDFIISLDKSKADKLRYKVEDKVVKIFITPYRTSISEQDLDFSHGDFNVDVVIALGVHQQEELDRAITSHGRILHDATIISVNNVESGNLGSMNWIDTSVSSLSELVSQLDGQLGRSVLDAQIATALLTGIVAETNRFSNNKTSSQTMTVSAKLMAAGANQQLVATKLEEPPKPELSATPQDKPANSLRDTPGGKSAPVEKSKDGTIKIEHTEKTAANPKPLEALKLEEPQIHIDDEGALTASHPFNPKASSPATLNPLSLGEPLIASSVPETLNPLADDPLSLPSVQPPSPNSVDNGGGRPPVTLTNSSPPASASNTPHFYSPTNSPSSTSYLDDARNAVEAAAAASTEALTPRVDLNAQPVFGNLQPLGQPNPDLNSNLGAPVPAPFINTASDQALDSQSVPLIPAPTINNVSAPADESAYTLNMPMPKAASPQLDTLTTTPADDEEAPSGAPNSTRQLLVDSSHIPPPPVPPPMIPPPSLPL